MTRLPALLFLLAPLAGCGDDGPTFNTVKPSAAWQAGPIINSRNYSAGSTIEGNTLTVPASASAHYVTRAGRLKDTRRITASFRYEGEAHPVRYPDAPPMLTLYFACGASWSEKPDRWFATATAVRPIPHEVTIAADLDRGWTPVAPGGDQAGFVECRDKADTVGFVLGGGDGLGHGITGPATLTILSFAVE